jgi:hypothetical protein
MRNLSKVVLLEGVFLFGVSLGVPLAELALEFDYENIGFEIVGFN